MNMRLNEFASCIAADTKVRIVEKDIVLYEGDAGTLNKLLSGYVNKCSGKVNDEAFQIEVTRYQYA